MIHSDKLTSCEFVLFGAKGDLARRKLLPSLFLLDQAELLHHQTDIVCVAREALTVEQYREVVAASLNAFLPTAPATDALNKFLARINYIKVDLVNDDDYHGLSSVLSDTRTTVCYFATPPAIYGNICRGLHTANLIDPSTRVVLEKPIGHDLESSSVINDKVAEFFEESQIYRIDHYLGKETVLNLIALRFANSLFSTHWDYTSIDQVQITVAESVGIEGRWGYFDDAGQMRDMVQNHLLQILTLIAMEPPADLDADSIRDEKLKVLKALKPIDSSNVHEKTVRGQYTGGFVNGAEVPGYLDEPDANTQSTTETFVSLKVELDNWRWAGVPFYLRTGKRMPCKASEIVIYFKRQPHNLFKDSYNSIPRNKLIIKLQPDEGVEVMMMNKVPGLTSSKSMDLQKTKLNLSFSETFNNERIADAYEKLLLEVMLGNQALFVRRDEVEEAWNWVDSIINAWQGSREAPHSYQAGTWGPVASIAQLARDEHAWYEITSGV